MATVPAEAPEKHLSELRMKRRSGGGGGGVLGAEKNMVEECWVLRKIWWRSVGC